MPIASPIGDLYAKCLPAFGTDVDRCGALTLCNISPTGIDELEAIYSDKTAPGAMGGRWRIIGALLEADFMGKACGVKQNGFYDFIMANRREWGTKRLGLKPLRRDVMEIMPFVQMERKGPINNYYWTVSATGAGGATWDLTATVTSQTGIPADIRWFPAGIRVFISGKSAGGTKYEAAYKVVDVTVAGANHTLFLKNENVGSFLPVDKKTLVAPGILRRGTVNVNDYERYCAQIPGLNPKQMVPFWIGTTRWTSCEDELVKKYLQLLRENNPMYREFGDIEAVELNRQLLGDFQMRHSEAFFFAKPLDKQNLIDYDQLEQINVFSDASMGGYIYSSFEGRCIGRRAEPIGIYEQHAECGRVKDLQGQVLNIPELQKLLYSIKRTRESNGIPADTIEMYTDSFYAVQLAQGFLRYFAYKSEGLLRLNMDISQGGTGKQGPLGFWFTEFVMDYPKVKLRVVTHPYFDDLVDAHTTASSTLTSAGRVLWILDWSTNYQSVIESNAITNVSGDIKTLASVSEPHLCVMKVPRKSVRLNSLTYTNVAECPQSSMFLENISSEVPEHLRMVGSYADYYGDYIG